MLRVLQRALVPLDPLVELVLTRIQQRVTVEAHRKAAAATRILLTASPKAGAFLEASLDSIEILSLEGPSAMTSLDAAEQDHVTKTLTSGITLRDRAAFRRLAIARRLGLLCPLETGQAALEIFASSPTSWITNGRLAPDLCYLVECAALDRSSSDYGAGPLAERVLRVVEIRRERAFEPGPSGTLAMLRVAYAQLVSSRARRDLRFLNCAMKVVDQSLSLVPEKAEVGSIQAMAGWYYVAAVAMQEDVVRELLGDASRNHRAD